MKQSVVATILFTSMVTYSLTEARARTFNVKNYGAVGDGQHNDQPAIQAAVNAAITSGKGNTVYIPRGSYLLDPTDGDGNNTQIVISQASDLSMVGENGTYLINPVPTRGFIRVWGSSNTTIDHITMRQSHRLFSQVKVESVNASNNSIVVSVNKGFDDLNSKWIQQANQLLVFNDEASGSWGDHSASCSYYAPAYESVCWPPVVQSRTRIANGKWRLGLNTTPQANYVGATAVVWDQTNHSSALYLSVNNGFTISNSEYYPEGSDGLFYAKYNNGKFLIKNVTLSVPDGSGEFVAGYSGMWSANNKWDLDFENSTLIKVWDDVINTGAQYAKIVSKANSTTINVDRASAIYAPGDTVSIWDWTPGSQYERSRAKITSVACGPDVAGQVCTLQLDRPVDVRLTVNSTSVSREDIADRLIDLAGVGSLKVNNCAIQGFHSSGIYSKASPTLITNSMIFDTVGPAVAIGPSFNFGEGSSPNNIQIRNNTFINDSSSNVMIGTERDGSKYIGAFMDGHDIDVSGNRFFLYGRFTRGAVGDTHYPIYLRYIESGKVNGNFILPYDGQVHGYGSTYKQYSPNVSVTNDYQ
ncbi:glycosyl hydrolase family 28-related protein [Rhizosaccharibacter radicis]|uniref:Glycoside hydrolase family 55 protein n=1 Tax=Rhizosaccharibacter radicis TaxID=2782605 RepID=A0ABT1W3M0_9PROT|nr:glycoside hydrolase family 55 protein [Acetobacteraceae bacterium KSS12]